MQVSAVAQNVFLFHAAAVLSEFSAVTADTGGGVARRILQKLPAKGD